MHDETARSHVRRPDLDEQGLSMVVTAISLLVTALLVLIALKATGVSGSGKSTAPSQSVSLADAGQAQQNLAQAVSALQQTDTGGQGSIDAAALQSVDSSVTYTSGASASPSTVSVTPQSDGSSVVLTDRSFDGNCWLVWWSPTAGTWFGVQPGQSSCTAPSLTGTPTPAVASDSTIGWQQGSFPTA